MLRSPVAKFSPIDALARLVTLGATRNRTHAATTPLAAPLYLAETGRDVVQHVRRTVRSGSALV